MAQANPTQREPSMEEILASIRRIIEDSDNEKKRDVAPPARAANDAADTGRVVEAFRAELRTESAPDERLRDVFMEQAFTEDAAPSLELPELEDDQTYAPEMVKGEAYVEPHSENFIEPHDFQVDDHGAEMFAPAAAPQEEAEDFDIDLDIDAFAETNEAPAAEVAPEPVHFEPEAEPVIEIEGQPEAALEQPFRSPILSEKAGKQVAAAFGELSEAFAASRRKSFDEMAEEMIRPMLQEWMDNNLPHLVEKLVREEIERIARG